MFKKILIANRGEIAVRVIRACRELGVRSVALYAPAEIGSLHVRLADECAPLEGPAGFLDGEAVLHIALEKGADAIHPGYGFLAEQPAFVARCQAAGVRFIGPPLAVMDRLLCKIEALKRAAAAGYPTALIAPLSAGALAESPLPGSAPEAIRQAAQGLGYPLVVKACFGGRGPGERLVGTPDELPGAVASAQAEAATFFQDASLYLEKAILPGVQVGVQVLRDRQGRGAALGEVQVLAQRGNRRVIAESPAPVLSPARRKDLHAAALELAALFEYENFGTVEFKLDERGRFYFTEMKARLTVEHPLVELLTRIDLVQAQLRLAAGGALDLPLTEARGSALLCRVNAEDPWNDFLPSPGRVGQLRLPGGPEVRVDTYLVEGAEVPEQYDPLVAKLAVWGPDRGAALERMRRALEEFKLTELPSNLALLRNILSAPEFVAGRYTTDFALPAESAGTVSEDHRRDLAAAAAIMYLLRDPVFQPQVSAGRKNGWHRNLHLPPRWNYSGINYEKNDSHY